MTGNTPNLTWLLRSDSENAGPDVGPDFDNRRRSDAQFAKKLTVGDRSNHFSVLALVTIGRICHRIGFFYDCLLYLAGKLFAEAGRHHFQYRASKYCNRIDMRPRRKTGFWQIFIAKFAFDAHPCRLPLIAAPHNVPIFGFIATSTRVWVL